jgi:hypothetical protein
VALQKFIDHNQNGQGFSLSFYGRRFFSLNRCTVENGLDPVMKWKHLASM